MRVLGADRGAGLTPEVRASLEVALAFAVSSGAWLVRATPLSRAPESSASLDGPLSGGAGRRVGCPCGLERARGHVAGGARRPRLAVVARLGGDPATDPQSTDGRTRALFENMLRAFGLEAEDICIAACAQGDEEGDERARCLRAGLEAVGPRVVCALGADAARCLLEPGSGGRGEVRRAGRFPLVVTFDPAELLSVSGAKRLAWEDLRLVRGLLAAAGPA